MSDSEIDGGDEVYTIPDSATEPDVKRARASKAPYQATRFCGTWHLHPKDFRDEFSVIDTLLAGHASDGAVNYAVGELEFAPSTGKPHAQFYFEIPRKSTITGCKKLWQAVELKHPHLEVALGTGTQNRDYCLKEKLKLDGDEKDSATEVPWFEHGAMKAARGVKMRNDWDGALALARSHRISDIPAQIQIPYFQNLQRIAFTANEPDSDLDILNNYWFWGKPGVGKSRLARHIAKEATMACYIKDAMNKWFDGYAGEPAILLDDLEKDAKHQAHLLKTLADRYPMRIEIKGAMAFVRPKMVLVTSNYHPSSIWDDTEVVAAIRRRFRVIRVTSFDDGVEWAKKTFPGDDVPVLAATAVNDGFTVPPSSGTTINYPDGTYTNA